MRSFTRPSVPLAALAALTLLSTASPALSKEMEVFVSESVRPGKTWVRIDNDFRGYSTKGKGRKTRRLLHTLRHRKITVDAEVNESKLKVRIRKVLDPLQLEVDVVMADDPRKVLYKGKEYWAAGDAAKALASLHEPGKTIRVRAFLWKKTPRLVLQGIQAKVAKSTRLRTRMSLWYPGAFIISVLTNTPMPHAMAVKGVSLRGSKVWITEEPKEGYTPVRTRFRKGWLKTSKVHLPDLGSAPREGLKDRLRSLSVR